MTSHGLGTLRTCSSRQFPFHFPFLDSGSQPVSVLLNPANSFDTNLSPFTLVEILPSFSVWRWSLTNHAPNRSRPLCSSLQFITPSGPDFITILHHDSATYCCVPYFYQCMSDLFSPFPSAVLVDRTSSIPIPHSTGKDTASIHLKMVTSITKIYEAIQDELDELELKYRTLCHYFENLGRGLSKSESARSAISLTGISACLNSVHSWSERVHSNQSLLHRQIPGYVP